MACELQRNPTFWVYLMISAVLSQQDSSGSTLRADEDDKVSLWVVAGVAGLIALIIICMIIFVCLIYCKKKEERMKVVHVRAVEDWTCNHKPIILENRRVGSGVYHSSYAAAIQTEATWKSESTLPPPSDSGCDSNHENEREDKESPRPKKVTSTPTPRKVDKDPKVPKGVWLPHSKPVRSYLAATSTK